MSLRKVEGTYILDGMLEGYLADPADEQCVRRFVQQTRECRIGFHMVTEGERFTLLPDKKSSKLPAGVESVTALLKHPLENLLACFAAEDATQFISTLRSIEYTPGAEKQALYCIGPDGMLMIEQRSVPAQTVPASTEISTRDKLKMAAVALAAFLVLFGISALFVPYGEIAGNLYEAVKPYDLEGLAVQASIFDPYFAVEKVDRRMNDGQLIVICRKTDQCPTTEQEFNAAWSENRNNLYRCGALEAIARGSIVCKLFDGEGRLIGQDIAPMVEVKDEPGVFVLAVPFKKAVEKITLSF